MVEPGHLRLLAPHQAPPVLAIEVARSRTAAVPRRNSVPGVNEWIAPHLEPMAEYLNVGPKPKQRPKTGSCAFSTGIFRIPGPRGARRGQSARVPPPHF